MKFVGFTSGSDESRRSCEQFFRWNAETIGQGPEPVSCRLSCRVVLDSVDIAWCNGLSKAGALLRHIHQRETLLVPDSANEVPEGFWTPSSHSNGLHIHFNARTRRERKPCKRQNNTPPTRIVLVGVPCRKRRLLSGNESFIIGNVLYGTQFDTYRH
jgi:hypothetical protein